MKICINVKMVSSENRGYEVTKLSSLSSETERQMPNLEEQGYGQGSSSEVGAGDNIELNVKLFI